MHWLTFIYLVLGAKILRGNSFSIASSHSRQKLISKQASVSSYVGPCPSDGVLGSPQARVQVPDLGLVFTVADSIAGEGLGLFVNLLPGVEAATIPCGTVLGSYARGHRVPCESMESDKAVRFELTSGPDSWVMVVFKGGLIRIQEVLDMEIGEQGLPVALAGHSVIPCNDGGFDVRLSDEVPVECFIPDKASTAADLSCLDDGVGQFANDLAIKPGCVIQTLAEYEEISQASNIFTLQWALSYDTASNTLVPKVPQSVFFEDVTFTNSEPMEVGCRYGFGFWE